MKIAVSCGSCNEKVSVEIDGEKRFVTYCCTAEHRNMLIIQSHKSEILFDRGCIFYHKGYYREAIFNFYGALEKYRELFINFLLLNGKFSDANITKLWKEIKLSERQYGAYCLMQIIAKSESDMPNNKKIIEMRNDVIHGGKLPTKNAAYKFGEIVFTLIQNDHTFLKGKGDYLSMVVNEIFYQEQPKEEIPCTTILFPGFQLMGLRKEKKFDFILEHIKEHLINPDSGYFQA